MNKKLLIGALPLLGFALAGQQVSNIAMPEKGTQDKFIVEFLSSDRAAYLKAGSALNQQIVGEGTVLLKNRENILPLEGVEKVSVFGKASINLQTSGGGSGSGSNQGEQAWNLQQSLEAVGYELNPTLTTFYQSEAQSGKARTNGNSGWEGISEATIGETDATFYTSAIKETFAEYNDAAVVLLARGGTEGADCKTYDARDHAVDPMTTNHYLELSKNEMDMFDMIEQDFDKIIVLLNTGNIMQCDRFETDDQIDAVLWMGTPGAAGTKSIGEILSGEINPSGRTVSTWTRDFTKDPTFQNFADNSQHNIYPGLIDPLTSCDAWPGCTMFNADGTPLQSDGTYWGAPVVRNATTKAVEPGCNGTTPSSYVSYEEGVYMDYRYYETRYVDMEKASKGSGETWYESAEGVIYPFGYGLSYSTFNQEIVSSDVVEGTTLTGKKKEINVTVKVTNTGSVAGKDVVQLYWKAPYIVGGIEKAYEVLCAFGKTEILAPGASEEVKVSFFLQDVANYDCDDKNNNSFKGYELDAGDYSISVNKNAHEVYDELKLKVKAGGLKYENDRFSGNKVENRFTDRGFFNSLPGENDVEFTPMSRANFVDTFPEFPSEADRTVKVNSRASEYLNHRFVLDDVDVDTTFEFIPAAAHKSKADIEALGWQQQATALAKANRIQFVEMIGVEFDDPAWDEFLNEFTYAELRKFVEDGTFKSIALDAIGKRSTRDEDGPVQFTLMFWAGAPTVAATFNQELAQKQGEMVGTEAHISGGSYGWLGPAVNTHRSPFGGRNFEYYSADPFLMGRMGAKVVGAATDKGVYCYFKHFGVNDQEKNREGVCTYASEQAIREIYLRAFQMVIQEGHSTGVMSSYNRLGLMETAASYPLLTEVLRNEWGFKGAVLSDMTHFGSGTSEFDWHVYENINYRALSGCNAQLDNSTFGARIQATWDISAFDGKGCPVFDDLDGNEVESYSWWYAVRTCAKEMLYNYANSGGAVASTVEDSVKLAQNVTLNDLAVREIDIELDKSANIALDVGEQIITPAVLDSEGNETTPAVVKAVTSFESTVDEQCICPFPAGLSLDDNVIYGTPTEAGNYRAVILLTVTYDDATTANLGIDIIINVVDPNYDVNEVAPVIKKGCFGGITTFASTISLLAFVGFGVLFSKRKEEKN